MRKIISIHSFRGGTGKSNVTANLAAIFADQGKRVGIVDTDIQSPGIHVLLGLDEASVTYSLNDYLWGKCTIEQAATDVTSNVDRSLSGKIFLIPSSIKASDIARILRQGYDIERLNDGFIELLDKLNLDILLIDTHPGLNEETLLSIAISDVLIIVLRPDQQDFQGTNVTVEVARRLGVQDMTLLVNKVPQMFDAADVETRVRTAYECDVGAVIPHSDEIMALASGGVFVAKYPDHPISLILRDFASNLLS